MTWCSGLEAICATDVPLAEHTWYRLGGPARWLFTPRDEEELAELLQRCTREQISWRILGRGANVLVRDEGFNGVVIKLSGAEWERMQRAGHDLVVKAGADFPRLVKQSVEWGLAGLEGLAGIPGTVGGTVRMNAGGRHGCIADVLRDVRVVTPMGMREQRAASELGFAYRTSRLDGAVIVSATFGLSEGDRAELLGRHRAVWQAKAAQQPAVAQRSAGCIFKNPPNHAAGALIEQAGLKGHRRGGAQISPRHANFIVAGPDARAQDVVDLIMLARERVLDHAGIELELEVEIW